MIAQVRQRATSGLLLHSLVEQGLGNSAQARCYRSRGITRGRHGVHESKLAEKTRTSALRFFELEGAIISATARPLTACSCIRGPFNSSQKLR